MSHPYFPDLTIETAPEEARPHMRAMRDRLGYLPHAVARMAHSPGLLDGFGIMTRLFDASALAPIEREVVVMTIATRNDCELCVAMHTTILRRLRADADVVAALRAASPIPVERLEALRRFTLAVVTTAGGVSDDELTAFTEHGFTARDALDVVLGVGAYTLSTFANRLTRAPIDPPLRPFAP